MLLLYKPYPLTLASFWRLLQGGIIAIFWLLSSPMFPYHNKVLEPLLSQNFLFILIHTPSMLMEKKMARVSTFYKERQGPFNSHVPSSKRQTSSIKHHQTIIIALIQRIRTPALNILHNPPPPPYAWTMLLSPFLAFLVACLAHAATLQLILDGPDPTACHETPTTTTTSMPTTITVQTTPTSVSTPVPTPSKTPECSSCPNLDIGTLGIRYGRCYTMTDIDGKPFRWSAVNSDRFYWIGGSKPVRNIPFRICANSTRCDLSQDEFVLEGGKWYFQDQIGFEDKPTADFVGTEKGSDNTNWFLTNTALVANPNRATTIYNFTAQVKCLFGKCAPCVRFENFGILPWTPPTDASVGEALRVVSSFNHCFPIIFQETNCVNRPWTVPAWLQDVSSSPLDLTGSTPPEPEMARV